MSIVLWYNDFILVQQQRYFYDKCKYRDIRNIPRTENEHQSKVEIFFDDPFQEFLFKIIWMNPVSLFGVKE